MPVPLPTIIQGPAIVIFNGLSYYFKDGLKRSIRRESFDVETDAHGKVDTRLKSTLVEISGTPAGQLPSDANLAKMFPYALADIGKSVFGSPDKTLVIHTLGGQTITYARAAITKLPLLRLKPTDTLFGEMTWTALGKSATQPTAAGYWDTIASAAFSDATFDAAAIQTARYEAAWGASAPYNSMGSLNGFEFELTLDLVPTEVDDFGVVDMSLRSISGMARFAPASLSEAQVEAMMALQDTGAVLPGQSFAKAGTDLVIASDVFSATLHKCGPVDIESTFATGQHRHGTITFAARRAWSGGNASPLWTFDVL